MVVAHLLAQDHCQQLLLHTCLENVNPLQHIQPHGGNAHVTKGLAEQTTAREHLEDLAHTAQAEAP